MSVNNFTGWRSHLCILAACGLIVLLNGCQPAPTLTPRPTPHVLVVNITPALAPLRQPLNQCAEELENAGLVINELPAYADEPPAAALTLRWGAGSQPLAGSAAVLGQEELTIVVHPSVSLAQLSLKELREIYSGTRRSWPGSEPPNPVQPWVYPAGDDVLSVFQAAVLGGSAASPRVVSTAPDPAAMLEAVANSPGAVGFVPSRWLEQTAAPTSPVKLVTIPDLNADFLRQPILALSAAEPAGVEKTWLICLQEQLND